MAVSAARNRQKVLLIDDDQDFLDIYWEILKRLPSEPEIHTASNGARALALLESEPFDVMIVDLYMPRMDGLQVLSIAHRKYPQLRIVVMTAITDEAFRERAYSMGVDQFWQKPDSDKAIQQFLDAIESLLQTQARGGFRGVQSKGLVDIIQLECMSQSSGVLKITNGALRGTIWIQAGAVIDAEAQELTGEPAFRRILGWKGGSFEMAAAEPSHPRRIQVSYHALLLESAQAIDEAREPAPVVVDQASSPLGSVTQLPDVQFVLTAPEGGAAQLQAWGLESPETVSEWTQSSLNGFRSLGARLQFGELQDVTGLGSPSHVVMCQSERGPLAVGFRAAVPPAELRENLKCVLAKWAS